MANYSYDSSTDTLELIAGTPRAKLNEATSKAEASLDNQSDYIEAGTTATHAHSVGDYINYGASKQFAKVTSAIAVDDSIADGSNVENISIGGALTSLNNDLSNKSNNWTYDGHFLRTAVCDLSNVDFDELLLIAYNNDATRHFMTSVNLMKLALSNSKANVVFLGGGYTSTSTMYATVTVTTDYKISLRAFISDGTSKLNSTDDTYLVVYHR